MNRSKIPTCLWKENVVHFPRQLSGLYQEQIIEIGRYDEAVGPYISDVVGGTTEEETIEHFVHRFLASASRIEYLTLDPRHEFEEIPDNLITTFTDGRVSVLDVPCGTGAGMLSLLATLAELRTNLALASLPLHISVTAGDYAEKALEIYDLLLGRISPWLAQLGIHVFWKTHPWNATHSGQTSQLVDSWFQMVSDPEEYVVLISAFSGAVAQQFEEYEQSFRHILDRLYGKRKTILWVEPQWNPSKRMFRKIVAMLQKIRWFVDRSPSLFSAQYRWFHPLKRQVIERGTISVKRYDYN